MSGTFLLLANIFWIALLAVRLFAGWYSSVTLLEYQRGILYRNGLPARDVGVGRIRVWTGVEKVIQLDTRPIQVSYENQQVGLRDGSAAQYSFSGSARVQDARMALHSSTNYNQVPAYVFLCCARRVLNDCTSVQLKVNKEAVTQQILELAKPRLLAEGFEFLSFRMPQIAVRGDGVGQAEHELQ